MDIDFDPRRPKNCPLQRNPLSFCPQTKISCRNFANRTSLRASQIIVRSILDLLMPRKSLKAQFLNNLQTAIDHLKIIDEVHQLFFVGNSSSIYLEQAAFFESMHNQLSQCRYLFRTGYRETNHGRLREILYVSEEEFLTTRFHTEFLFHFPVSYEAFFKLHSFVKDHPVFQSRNSNGLQSSSEFQLLVLLKYIGSFGNAASNVSLGKFFGIGFGRIVICFSIARFFFCRRVHPD